MEGVNSPCLSKRKSFYWIIYIMNCAFFLVPFPKLSVSQKLLFSTEPKLLRLSLIMCICAGSLVTCHSSHQPTAVFFSVSLDLFVSEFHSPSEFLQNPLDLSF